VPVRGPISWHAMAHNQIFVVPGKIWETGEAFLFSRTRLLHQIEQKDLKQLKSAPNAPQQ
jgi:hypothetical protein